MSLCNFDSSRQIDFILFWGLLWQADEFNEQILLEDSADLKSN
jgi:hypothetical protein